VNRDLCAISEFLRMGRNVAGNGCGGEAMDECRIDQFRGFV
jgi:hypothetical protein